MFADLQQEDPYFGKIKLKKIGKGLKRATLGVVTGGTSELYYKKKRTAGKFKDFTKKEVVRLKAQGVTDAEIEDYKRARAGKLTKRRKNQQRATKVAMIIAATVATAGAAGMFSTAGAGVAGAGTGVAATGTGIGTGTLLSTTGGVLATGGKMLAPTLLQKAAGMIGGGGEGEEGEEAIQQAGIGGIPPTALKIGGAALIGLLLLKIIF